MLDWRGTEQTTIYGLLQAGSGANLQRFVAGPFDLRVGQHTHQIDLYVAPLKDRMLLGMDILWEYKTKMS